MSLVGLSANINQIYRNMETECAAQQGSYISITWTNRRNELCKRYVSIALPLCPLLVLFHTNRHQFFLLFLFECLSV